MRATLFTLLAAVSIVSAQNFAGEPLCATSCLISAISVGGCQVADEGCQCGSGFSAIQSAAAPCLLSACDQSDLAIAASVGLGLCSIYSASLASASAVTTKSSPSSTAVVTTSSIPVSTTSVTAITTSVPATTSKASMSKASSTSSGSSKTSSSAAPVSTNAAPAVIAGMSGLLGLGAAFVAAL